jgi:putative transposase
VSAFIDERRCDFGVELICDTLEISASAYYRRATGQRSARAVEDERLLGVIHKVHAANYEAYGSRRMWKALLRAGERVGRGHVERLMAANGICGAKRRGKPWRTTIAGADAVQSPDLVNRDFTASAPNRTWVADFTYIRCWKASCSSASSWTSTPGGSWAGSSPGTCAPSSSKTPSTWPSRRAASIATAC